MLRALKVSASLGPMPHLPTLKVCPIISHGLESSLFPSASPNPPICCGFNHLVHSPGSCSPLPAQPACSSKDCCILGPGSCLQLFAELPWHLSGCRTAGSPCRNHISDHLRQRFFQRLCKVRRPYSPYICSFFCKHTAGFSRGHRGSNAETDMKTQLSSLK